MNTIDTCAYCGKPLTPDSPQGLCPECLLKAGLGTGVEIGSDSRGESGAGTPRFNAPAPEELAARFPQLEILGLIGQGGMGAVYKVRQIALDRVAALKILPPGVCGDPAFAERFTREARALARLNHPGIVTLYEFGVAEGLYYFLMEYVDGMNLRGLLNAGRLSSREALAIVPGICDALQYAHDQGIVHRDIKPENILLDRAGRVKVADFGLAKLVNAVDDAPGGTHGATDTVSLTEAGKVMGTPFYMAPEQWEHPQEVDRRADIYSLGVVLYQMLTGELPGVPLEPPSRRIQMDVRIDEIVLRALEREPELRYQQVSEVKTDVETVTQPPGAEQTSSTETDDSPSQAPIPHKRTWPLPLVGLRNGERVIHWPGLIRFTGLIVFIVMGASLFFSHIIPDKKFLLESRIMEIGLLMGFIYLAMKLWQAWTTPIELLPRLIDPQSQSPMLNKETWPMPLAGLHNGVQFIYWPSPIRIAVLIVLAVVVAYLLFHNTMLYKGFLITSVGMQIGLLVLFVLLTMQIWQVWRTPIERVPLFNVKRKESKNGVMVMMDERDTSQEINEGNIPPSSLQQNSRLAVWGAFCLLVHPPGFLLYQIIELTGMSLQAHPVILWPLWILSMILMMGGIVTAIASPIMGWIAVSRIRRGAGRPHGLKLAMFDGLFFPLMVMNGIIGWLFWKGVFQYYLYFQRTMDYQIVGKRMLSTLLKEQRLDIVFLLTMVVGGCLSFLIIRKVWRVTYKFFIIKSDSRENIELTHPRRKIIPRILVATAIMASFALGICFVAPKYYTWDISGKVTECAYFNPISNALVIAHTFNGDLIARAITDGEGRYKMSKTPDLVSALRSFFTGVIWTTGMEIDASAVDFHLSTNPLLGQSSIEYEGECINFHLKRFENTEFPETTFGYNHQREVYDYAKGSKNQALDLETGVLYSRPIESSRWDNQKRLQWFADNGVDITVERQGNGEWMLKGYGLRLRRIPKSAICGYFPNELPSIIVKAAYTTTTGKEALSKFTEADINNISRSKSRERDMLKIALESSLSEPGVTQRDDGCIEYPVEPAGDSQYAFMTRDDVLGVLDIRTGGARDASLSIQFHTVIPKPVLIPDFGFDKNITEIKISREQKNDPGIYFFSFSDGNILRPPFQSQDGFINESFEFKMTPELDKWLKANDVDALIRLHDESWEMTPIGMRVRVFNMYYPCPNIDAKSILPLLGDDAGDNKKDGLLSGGVNGEYGKDFDSLTLFKTQSGTIGVYQIKGILSASSKGVGIRYKKMLPAFTKEAEFERSTRGPVDLKTDTYIVKPGDTFDSITKIYGLTEESIRKMNDLPPLEPIKDGQRLRILYEHKTQQPETVNPADSTPSGVWEETYIVKSGDSLAKISAMMGVPDFKIKHINALDSKTPLRIGQSLRIVHDTNMPKVASLNEIDIVIGVDDTLKTLSEKIGVDEEFLRQMNNSRMGALLKNGNELHIIQTVGVDGRTRFYSIKVGDKYPEAILDNTQPSAPAP